MSETRRQLFKASVLSVLGVSSAIGLAGCKKHDGFSDKSGPDALYAFEPIFALSDDKKRWYVFAVDMSDSEKRQKAYWTDYKNVGASPFDTVDVYSHLKNLKLLHDQATSFSIGTQKYFIDGQGYVEQTSANRTYAIATKWNEIPYQ